MFSSDIDGVYVRSGATGRQSLATSPTVQAKTHAATVTCTRTSPHGSPCPVLRLADRHLDAEEHERPAHAAKEPRIASALAPRPGREHEEDDPEGSGRTDVHVDRRLERADAAYRFASGMRACCGRERAGDDERADGGEQNRAAEARRLPAGAAHRRARCASPASAARFSSPRPARSSSPARSQPRRGRIPEANRFAASARSSRRSTCTSVRPQPSESSSSCSPHGRGASALAIRGFFAGAPASSSCSASRWRSARRSTGTACRGGSSSSTSRWPRAFSRGRSGWSRGSGGPSRGPQVDSAGCRS